MNRMKRILYLWVAALLLTSCASAEIQVDTNNLAERYGENAIVEASCGWNTSFLELDRATSFAQLA